MVMSIERVVQKVCLFAVHETARWIGLDSILDLRRRVAATGIGRGIGIGRNRNQNQSETKTSDISGTNSNDATAGLEVEVFSGSKSTAAIVTPKPKSKDDGTTITEPSKQRTNEASFVSAAVAGTASATETPKHRKRNDDRGSTSNNKNKRNTTKELIRVRVKDFSETTAAIVTPKPKHRVTKTATETNKQRAVRIARMSRHPLPVASAVAAAAAADIQPITPTSIPTVTSTITPATKRSKTSTSTPATRKKRKRDQKQDNPNESDQSEEEKQPPSSRLRCREGPFLYNRNQEGSGTPTTRKKRKRDKKQDHKTKGEKQKPQPQQPPSSRLRCRESPFRHRSQEGSGLWQWLLEEDGSPVMGEFVPSITPPNITKPRKDRTEKPETGTVERGREFRWEQKFTLLVAYQKKHKTTNVPTNVPGLGPWVIFQRYRYKNGTLTPERTEKLEAIGFLWRADIDGRKVKWENKFKLLAAYQKKHKTNKVHKNVPIIGSWVMQQRHMHKYGRLGVERVAKLDSIGFDWQGRILGKKKRNKNDNDNDNDNDSSNWTEMYQRLVRYQEEHLDTHVPRDQSVLWHWVAYQRYAYKLGSISLEHKRRLDYIQFDWTVEDRQDINYSWSIMYDRLKVYHAVHQNCLVPARFHEDLRLGSWVARQRHACTEADRIDLLNDLEFVWEGGEHKQRSKFLNP